MTHDFGRGATGLRLVSDNREIGAASAKPIDRSPDGIRKGLLAKVHIGRKALAIEESDYRLILERETGQVSAKDCTVDQLGSLLALFERMGFRAEAPKARRDLGNGTTIRKARALWISLYQLGAIDDGSDAALEAFGRRQLKVERLRWASDREGFRLVEALKAIAERHGWDQSVPSTLPTAEQVRLLKDRLVGAQLARLSAAGVVVIGPLTADRSTWSRERLESAAAELAPRLRRLRRASIRAAGAGQ